jgi:hypothetical protein
MRSTTTHTRVIGALTLVLATAVLVAPAAVGKPTPWQYGQPNLQGSQLDRLLPQAAAAQPDAFEQAVARHQTELESSLRATEEESSRAARSVYSDLVQPAQASTASAGDDGGSFDWGLFATLCAVGVGCLALGSVAFASLRDRRRVSTSWEGLIGGAWSGPPEGGPLHALARSARERRGGDTPRVGAANDANGGRP